jgi:predicted transcriptional regulator of viral defense system
LKSPVHLSAVEILRRLPTPLFTAADAAKFVSHENVFLYRAVRKGYIQKLANRIYWNVLFSPRPPAVESVACFARQPSYISGEWALNYHGVLLQVPTVCTAITLAANAGRRGRISYGGFVIEYSHIREALFLAAEILNLDGILMATPEKALLDTVYLRHRGPDRNDLELDGVNRERIRDLAAIYPRTVSHLVDRLFVLEETE